MPLTYAEPPEVHVTLRAGVTGNLPETVATSLGVRSQGDSHSTHSLRHTLRHKVTCNSAWRETGEWWKDESEKDFYRVHGDDGFAAVIGRDLATKEWRLYQLND